MNKLFTIWTYHHSSHKTTKLHGYSQMFRQLQWQRSIISNIKVVQLSPELNPGYIIGRGGGIALTIVPTLLSTEPIIEVLHGSHVGWQEQ